MATALTLYGVPAYTTTLSSATKMLAVSSGASSLGYNTSCGANTGYSELFPQGTTNTWLGLGSIPSPTGNGYLFDSTILEGQTLVAGTYSELMRLRVDGGSGNVVAGLYLVLHKRSSSGVFTPIGTLSLLAQTITNGVSANYTLSGSLSAMAFGAGDKLYRAIWVNITTPASGTAAIRADLSTSTTQGSVNNVLTTPGYNPTASIARPLTSISTALLATNSKAITSVSSALKATVGRSLTGVKANLLDGSIKLAAYSAGVYIPIQQQGISYSRSIDDNATGSFVVSDSGQNYPLEENNAIAIYDMDASKTLYKGFIDKVDEQFLPGSSTLMRTVSLKDTRYLAKKRLYPFDELPEWSAGAVFAEMHRTILNEEGVGAAYALRRDNTAATFVEGSLANCSASNGYLEITKAGTSYSKDEHLAADWNAGTFVDTQTVGNTITLNSTSAIKASATASESIGANNGNLYIKWRIWSGAVNMVADDVVKYDIWISSTSPKKNAYIDVVCADGYRLDAPGCLDQNGILAVNRDLEGWATDQWYHRDITILSSQVGAGKNTSYATLVIDGDSGGDYIVYVKNVELRSSSGSLKATLTSSNWKTNPPKRLSSVGYKNMAISQVTTYKTSGTRVSPAYTISSPGIAGASFISWQATGAENIDEQVQVEALLGGAWLACKNRAAIPCIVPGMNLTGKTLKLRQTLLINGPSPEIPPVLTSCAFSIDSAPNATKTDVSRAELPTDMTSGTLSHCSYSTGTEINEPAGLKIDGFRKSFDDFDFTNASYWGVGYPARTASFGGMQMTCDNGGVVLVRMGSGTYDTTVIEADVRIDYDTVFEGVGFVYRTTYWNNSPDTYAYAVYINSTQIVFGRGSNNSTGGWTEFDRVTAQISIGNWYHLKVQVGTDDVHHVFIDGVEYITRTDSTFSSGGGAGCRFHNGSGARRSGWVNNFGVSGDTSGIGTRTLSSSSLSSAGTVEGSVIGWNEDSPDSCSVDVQTSINGGSLYTTCTNGGPIPGLTNGMDVSSTNLLVKEILTTSNVGFSPTITGLYWQVAGGYSASGTRISPSLACDAAMLTSASSLNLIEDSPTDSTVYVDSSLDAGSSWTQEISGNPITGVVSDGEIFFDNFDSDTSSNYTYDVGKWLWDAANSRLVTTGASYGTLTVNGISTKNSEITLTTDMLQELTVVLRHTALNNHYAIVMCDNSGSYGPILDIHKITPGGGDVRLTGVAINFSRNTYHTIKISLIDNTFSLYFDGLLKLTYTDTSSPLTAAGLVGLERGTGTSHINSFSVLPLGENAAGKTVMTRQRLNTTNPLVSPKVLDVIAGVYGRGLHAGEILHDTKYKYTSVDSVLDDAANRSNLNWRIDENTQLLLSDRISNIAPFPIATANKNMMIATMPKITRYSPAYRNRQYITNCIDPQYQEEKKSGDTLGVATSWVLKYPVLFLLEISLDGVLQPFGIQDTDTDKNFYYQIGENKISLDQAVLPPLPTQEIFIAYIAAIPYTAKKENIPAQTLLALRDGTSGIYEATEDGAGLLKNEADARAQMLLDTNSILSMEYGFMTHDNGLDPGQIVSLFAPEHGLNDVQFLITAISTGVQLKSDNTLFYTHNVSVTTGPNVGSWKKKLKLELTK